MDLNFTVVAAPTVPVFRPSGREEHLFQRIDVRADAIVAVATSLRHSTYIDLLTALLWIALRDWIEVATALYLLDGYFGARASEDLVAIIGSALKTWGAAGVCVVETDPARALLAAGRSRAKLGAIGVPMGQDRPVEITDADWQLSTFGGDSYADRIGSLGRFQGVVLSRAALERRFRPARGSATSTDRLRIRTALRAVAQVQREAVEAGQHCHPIVKARWIEQVGKDYAASGKHIGLRVLREIWDEVRCEYPEISNKSNKPKSRKGNISNGNSNCWPTVEQLGKAA